MASKFDHLLPDTEAAKLDADVSAPGAALFFRRQLEYIIPQLFEKRLPDLSAFTLFHIDSSVPDGAETYTFRMYEPAGVADFISDYAGDLPSVDVSAREQTFPVRDLGDRFQYSSREIAAAQMAGFPLDAQKAKAARRAIEEKHNRTYWYGNAAKGIYGVIGYPYMPRTLVSTPISSATTDANDIVEALNNLIYTPMRQSNGVEGRSGLVLVLPVDEYTHIHSRRMDSGTDTTIAEFILDKNPSLARIESANELAANPNDPLNPLASGTAYALVYDPDPRVISCVMPRPFTQAPAQYKSLAVIMNCHSSTGGVCMKYPLGAVLAELTR